MSKADKLKIVSIGWRRSPDWDQDWMWTVTVRDTQGKQTTLVDTPGNGWCIEGSGDNDSMAHPDYDRAVEDAAEMGCAKATKKWSKITLEIER